MEVLIALLIFIFTLILVIVQPRGLSIGWSASIGAMVAIIFGVVSFQDVIAVTEIVWNATLTFVALVIISLVLDELGFFEWAALHMAKLANGNGLKMFIFIIILGALVSALFANDGAVLIITPIVLAMIRSLNFTDKMLLPFVMASGFIADTASLPFIISNLTNIVSADFFGLGFVEYAIAMIVPNLFSILASLLVLYLYFRKTIPKDFDKNLVKRPIDAIKSIAFFKITWYMIAILIIGYILSEVFQIPLSFITGAAAIFLLISGKHFQVTNVHQVVKNAPWSVIFFSIGMYVIVYGLKNVGMTSILSTIIVFLIDKGLFIATVGTGFLAAFLSSIMNNLPTVMINSIAIGDISIDKMTEQMLVYANIIGTNLGPKITPIGSLATLLWLHVLNKDGIHISWGYYFKVGFILTIPTLFITLISLYIWGLIVL
ncbi:arsenic transporter [Pseudogracilibacillus sp. SO30301A]|uniref:arsenic transporter n=1 Tax=Pseudogracilibacillus sp. SO30301A TaxID=3098291 RepID=UPI00300E41A9